MSSTKRDIFKKFGASLIRSGQKMLRKAFDVQTYKTFSRNIRINLSDLGMNKGRIWTADNEFYYTDKKTMREIIEYDWTDKKEYVAERYDCDNFADVFSAHMMEIFDLNTAGVAWHIELVDPEDDSHIGWHRANVILVKEDGEKAYYLYEPENDGWTKIEKDKDLVIGNWKYKLNIVEFN